MFMFIYCQHVYRSKQIHLNAIAVLKIRNKRFINKINRLTIADVTQAFSVSRSYSST